MFNLKKLTFLYAFYRPYFQQVNDDWHAPNPVCRPPIVHRPLDVNH